MDYKIKRILTVGRYEKLGEEKCPTTGVILTRYKDTRTQKDFLTFKSYEDAKKYYMPWVGHNEEALKWYIENAVLESQVLQSTIEVIEFETPFGLRYQRNTLHGFSFGKSDFITGVHLPVNTTSRFPSDWFYLNTPMSSDDKLTIGIGDFTLSKNKSYSQKLTIEEFKKIMMKKGKFYTPYIFENNHRKQEKARIEENSITLLCIDIDDEDNIYEVLKEFENGKPVDTLLNRTTYYLRQVSKSGKGLHIFIPVKVKNKKQMDQILAYMQLEYKGLADISIYEPARLIFSSPYKIEEVCKVALARDFYKDKQLMEKEEVKELHYRLQRHQLSEEGHKNYVKKDGPLYIRTYIDGDRLLKYFKEKHGKLTSKKLFATQISISNNEKTTSEPQTSSNKKVQELKSEAIATVRGEKLHNPKLKSEVRRFQQGLIGFIQELSEKVGFPFKIYEHYDENGKVKRYYQISVSPNEKTPFDIFFYEDNPEFFYFQSENALRHFPWCYKYIVSYTQDGRPVLHISHLIKVLQWVCKNFDYKITKAEFWNLVMKYKLHERYIYSHFEKVEGYVVEFIKELMKKPSSPVLVKKFVPSDIISRSKVFRALRNELEKLGFKFKRTQNGLVVWWEEVNENELKETGFKGLPPRLRKILREFFAKVKVKWYEEWLEEVLEIEWVKNLWWWIHRYVDEKARYWESLFKRRLRDDEFVFWEDKMKLISAKAYVITKLVA